MRVKPSAIWAAIAAALPPMKLATTTIIATVVAYGRPRRAAEAGSREVRSGAAAPDRGAGAGPVRCPLGRAPAAGRVRTDGTHRAGDDRRGGPRDRHRPRLRRRRRPR